MVDSNYKKIEVGQEASALVFGHCLNVEIYDVNNGKVSFRTIDPKSGQPRNGWFNKIEAQRYMCIK